MTNELIIKYSLGFAITIFYLQYTIRYSISFRTNLLFTGRLKTFHFFMMWLIPFFWILILKSLTKTTPGSYEIKNKKNPDSFTESGLGQWAEPPPDN